MQASYTYLSLQSPNNEPLFSDSADYESCLAVLAELSGTVAPITGYCLLECELHLLVVASADTGRVFAGKLMQSLTGSASHPLMRYWNATPVTPAQVPNQLAALHLLPCTYGLLGDLGIHPWSSHWAYAEPIRAPQWLATEATWRLICPRRAGRIRTYLQQVKRQQVTSNQWPIRIPNNVVKGLQGDGLAVASIAEVSEAAIAERVLGDYECQWQHLQQTRYRRRKTLLAGLATAICQYLGQYHPSTTALGAMFDLAPEALQQAARIASRNASQYIISTAAALQGAGNKPPQNYAPLKHQRSATRVTAETDVELELSLSDFIAAEDADLPSTSRLTTRQ